MKSDDDETNRARARYEFACRARELELDLFWKRSLFFWGFIGAAFIAYSAVRASAELATLIAGFGFVCSLVWTLANRGSKFWYENWEQKVKKSEIEFTGPWFNEPEPPKTDNFWLSGRRFSVSKLAIALSDYVFGLWLILLVARVADVLAPAPIPDLWRTRVAGVFGIASVLYGFLVVVFTRSTKRGGKGRHKGDA